MDLGNFALGTRLELVRDWPLSKVPRGQEAARPRASLQGWLAADTTRLQPPLRDGIEMRYLSLALFLFAFWLTLSGHYTPMLVVAGAASAALCTLAAARMRVADAEGHPIELCWGAVTYFPWLAREIARSAWAVTKLILHPRLPISPTMTVVRASQRTSVGVATYANSITLTPGKSEIPTTTRSPKR
jgi:multicomponent Na+:H+ antiporter subunit E